MREKCHDCGVAATTHLYCERCNVALCDDCRVDHMCFDGAENDGAENDDD